MRSPLDSRPTCIDALALAFVLTLGCDKKSEPQPDSSTPVVTLEAGAAADALASVESGPPEAHPELALRALAKLERERLGRGFADGLALLVDAPDGSRMVALAPVIGEHLAMIDAVCGGGAEALMSELSMLEEARKAELIGSRCALGKAGLMADASEAAKADPAVLLMVHAAHARLKSMGELEPSELELLKLALRFGS